MPNFIGIGVPRAGTTWLYELLKSHPDVYVPRHRKEIHFFDRNSDCGLSWYQGFFPNDDKSSQYKAIGEFTPHYLSCGLTCAKMMAEIVPDAKLILMLRNPIDRAFSHYRFRLRIDNLDMSFETFLKSVPEATKWGIYAPQIIEYLEFYDRNQLLVFVYETATSDVEATEQDLASFLNIRVDKFPLEAGRRTINSGFMPKFGHLYAMAVSLARRLRKWNLDPVISLVKRLGMKRVVSVKEPCDMSMKPDVRQKLRGFFREDILAVEQLLDIDLSIWKTV